MQITLQTMCFRRPRCCSIVVDHTVVHMMHNSPGDLALRDVLRCMLGPSKLKPSDRFEKQADDATWLIRSRATIKQTVCDDMWHR